MHKAWILIILLGMVLFSSSGYAEVKEKDKSWKGSVTETNLIAVINFLINNKGKDIDIAGKKHRITGKEELDVEITFLSCCDEKEVFKYISGFGKVKGVKFPIFHASVPADKIPEIDKNGEVEKIKFEPEKREFWMKAIKQWVKG